MAQERRSLAELLQSIATLSGRLNEKTDQVVETFRSIESHLVETCRISVECHAHIRSDLYLSYVQVHGRFGLYVTEFDSGRERSKKRFSIYGAGRETKFAAYLALPFLLDNLIVVMETIIEDTEASIEFLAKLSTEKRGS